MRNMKVRCISISVGSLIMSLLIMFILLSATIIIKHGPSPRNNMSNDFASITGKLTKEETAPYTSQLSIRREEIEQILRHAIVDSIKEVENYGGYLIGYEDSYFPNKTVDFKGKMIPLYRVCDKTHYPTLEEIRQRILRRFLNLSVIRLSRYASSHPEIDFRGLNFNLSILDGKVLLVGEVYAYYKGKPIPGDYYLSIPTKLKEIYEYATSFSEFTKNTRFLDYLFIYTLYKAKEDYFPTRDIMTKCGEQIIKDRFELSHAFMDLYYHFISNVNFNIPPSKAKEYEMEEDDPIFFLFSKIIKDNKLVYYEHLKEIELFAPDDFFFIFPEGVSIINNEPVLKVVVPIGDKCVKYYDIDYSFPFPYVIGIRDDYISDDTYFYFAEYSYIDKMTPASCDYDDIPDNTKIFIPGLETSESYSEKLIEEKGAELGIVEQCKKDKKVIIQVVDDSNKPIEGAKVSYGVCSLGSTDAYGRVIGWISNEEDVLRISPPKGYVGYSKKMQISSTYLKIILPRIKDIEDIDVKYIKVSAALESPSNEPNKYAYIGIHSSLPGVLPNAILELRKCEISNEKPSDISMDVTFSLSPISYSVSNIEDNEYLNPGKVYSDTLDINNNKGKISLSFGKYYIGILEYFGEQSNENYNLAGSFHFDSSQFIEDINKRSIQIIPNEFTNFNIPIINVVYKDNGLDSYVIQGTSYLNIPNVAIALYPYQTALDEVSKRLSTFIYEGCGIDPFEEPEYTKYYAPITCEGWVEAAMDCGVEDIHKYYHIDPITEEWICDYDGIKQAMNALGCKVKEGKEY